MARRGRLRCRLVAAALVAGSLAVMGGGGPVRGFADRNASPARRAASAERTPIVPAALRFDLRPAAGSADPGTVLNASATLLGAEGTSAEEPATGRSLLETSQIVSYYGNPLAMGMGVLGQGTETEMLERLKMQAAAYQALNPDKAVIPALHLVYEVAQKFTSDDGLFLYRTEDQIVQHLISVTQAEHMLLFLDLQIGRSTLASELEHALPYLKQPNVNLAIDPEFVTPKGQRPGDDIGTLDGGDVTAALDALEGFVEREDLPSKIVILHQFRESMLTNKDKLRFDEPRVDLVLDMDGFGDQTGKLDRYDTLVRQFGARHGGIKLFYKEDRGLLSEEQVEGLVPRPDIIIYQ